MLALVLPTFVAPLIDALPPWVLWLGLAYVALLAPFLALSAFGLLVRPALGKHATDALVGHLARDMVVLVASAHTALLRSAWRGLTTATRALLGQ